MLPYGRGRLQDPVPNPSANPSSLPFHLAPHALSLPPSSSSAGHIAVDPRPSSLPSPATASRGLAALVHAVRTHQREPRGPVQPDQPSSPPQPPRPSLSISTTGASLTFPELAYVLPDVGAQEPDATIDDDSYYIEGAYY
ncbi:uncharacterized protein [Triticum aestivum]|uniref:uncharacterized protein isoform X2 n=1 Tax=Triticum aestivum TaxID=4565 RepID=UPI001D010368|nr:uncharacterized protein LOC123172126 isoform X2 [Triticum aestivum]